MRLDDLAQIPGHTKPEAGRVLYQLAGGVPEDQAIVEVGVFKGRSVCYLGAGATAQVYGIDPWDLPGERYPFHWKQERPSRHQFTMPETREMAFAAAERFPNITLIQDFSVHAGETWAGPPIGLIYIDGDHRLDAVRADWKAWSPHLAPGALVLFDDHVPTCADVMTAVAEFVAAGWITPPEQVTRRLAKSRAL